MHFAKKQQQRRLDRATGFWMFCLDVLDVFGVQRPFYSVQKKDVGQSVRDELKSGHMRRTVQAPSFPLNFKKFKEV